MRVRKWKYSWHKFFHPILWVTAMVLLFPFSTVLGQSESVIFNSGSGTFTIPHRVSSIQVQAWGGGASGGVHTSATGTNADARGGGGGGASFLQPVAIMNKSANSASEKNIFVFINKNF